MLFGKFRTKLEQHRDTIINRIEVHVDQPQRDHVLKYVKDEFYNLARELDDLEETVMKTKGGTGLDYEAVTAILSKAKEMFTGKKE